MTFPQVRRTAVVLLAPLALAGWSSEASAQPQTPVTNAVASSGRTDHRGPSEGIKVHGHWTIEVHNPDGTVVSRREFENALESMGQTLLAAFLARVWSPGGWGIELSSPENGGHPCGNSTTTVICHIFESTYPGGTTLGVFRTLTVTRSGAGNGVLVLSGAATAGRTGSVSRVNTGVQQCNFLANCVGSSFPPLAVTATTIAPITVQTGQQIQVTVEISFSTPPAPAS